MRAVLHLTTGLALVLLSPAVHAVDWLFNAEHEAPMRVTGISQTDLWGGLAGNRGVGFSAGHDSGWWSLNTRIGYQDYSDPLRDGGAWQVGISAGREWLSGFDLRGRIGYERGSAQDARRQFDLESWRASAELDYALSRNWGLFATLGVQQGHLHSLNPDGEWRTYGVSARVVTFTFGSQIELGPATQFLVAWERLDGRDRVNGVDYDGNVYRFRLKHGF